MAVANPPASAVIPSFFGGLKRVLFVPPGNIFSVRAILAMTFTFTTCVLWLQEINVPSELLTLTSGTVAFYFGSRVAEVKKA